MLEIVVGTAALKTVFADDTMRFFFAESLTHIHLSIATVAHLIKLCSYSLPAFNGAMDFSLFVILLSHFKCLGSTATGIKDLGPLLHFKVLLGHLPAVIKDLVAIFLFLFFLRQVTNLGFRLALFYQFLLLERAIGIFEPINLLFQAKILLVDTLELSLKDLDLVISGL